MNLEDTLISWTKPSSDSEQEKQDRAERMIRQAIDAHEPFRECPLSIYAKGSYANNTNVRSDSDVDIAVECTDVFYWEEAEPGAHGDIVPYKGIWTPEKLRSELVNALEKKFPEQVDTSGSTAIQINSNSARVDADVVPCFTYYYYLSSNSYRKGTKIFTKTGKKIVNYPAQQIENGKSKNIRTNYAYKKAARILKRVENAMVADKAYRELPSYFVECLAYNCPDSLFTPPDLDRHC
jgi:predicted nucleotidyltransferase